MGGQENKDRICFSFPDLLCCFQTANRRHLNIQKENVKRFLRGIQQSFAIVEDLYLSLLLRPVLLKPFLYSPV